MEEQKKKTSSLTKWVIVVLIAISVVLGSFIDKLKRENSYLTESIKLELDYRDTLAVRYNKKEKALEYSKATLVASNSSLNEFLKKKDIELYNLKKDNKAITGIIVDTKMVIDTIVNNVVDTVKDTRTAKISNEFYEADIVSSPDSTALRFMAYEKLKLSIGEDYRVRVTNKNPYVTVVDVESFYVKPDKKKSGWKYVVGAAAGLAGGYLIFK